MVTNKKAIKMKNKILIILLGIIGVFASCEKDGDMLTMLESPNAPQFITMPDLTFERADGSNELLFIAKPVDPGFEASATYFLEACVSGNNFEQVVSIYSGTTCDTIKINESELNQMLLKVLPEDQTSAVDFRLRSILTVDAGTSARGTGDEPFEYTSEINTQNVTVYGLLRLDLINSGMDQKIVSPLGNGKYQSYVKLDPANPFTLLDPETNISYGGSGGTLVVDGGGITIGDAGWYDFSADINGLTYVADPYFIGVVGSSTPNGWDAPDSKMDFDYKTGRWYITLDLVVGYIKFRKNDGWAWNMGLADSGNPGELQQGGVGNDIPIDEAGNYTVYFTIISDAKGTFELIKN